MDNCVYCGVNSSLARDHVIPASYFGKRSYDPEQQWLVTACERCNTLAGSAVYFSIPDKAKYILKRYRVKYRKVLDIPIWSNEELRELDYRLRTNIKESLVAKNLLQRKIQYLESIIEYPKDYLRPTWVKREYERWLQSQKTPVKRKRRSPKTRPRGK